MSKKKAIGDCQKLAKDKGGVCLSKTYTNGQTKMLWECKIGHKWYASYQVINSGHWCPDCGGSKRLTLNDCQKIAKNKSGKCLSTEYKNNSTKILWECKENHTWWASFSNIKSGKWCPECAGNQKLTIKDCIILAEKKNGKCVSKKYINAISHMLWECSEGHRWKASYSAINNRTWCPKCANASLSLSLKDCQSIAKSKGGVCLSKEYKNNCTKLLWKCEKGHVWKASLNSIRNHNAWCLKCAYISQSLTIEECQLLAKNNNGECLSKVYKNNKTKLLWKCEKGHTWVAAIFQIKRGHWCVECYNVKRRLGIKICDEIAKQRGGKLLSTEYKNNSTKMLWECSKGHQWYANLGNIKNNNRWCPKCSRKPLKSQNKLTDIIKKIFPKCLVQEEKRFSWLGMQSIDIYIPKLKLAIEYDGEQHFHPICFGGKYSTDKAKENLKTQKKRDRRKNKLIKKHPKDIKYFIRIPYTEKINEKNIIKILDKNNILTER